MKKENEKISLVIETEKGFEVTKTLKCPICHKDVFCLIDDKGEYNPQTHDKQCTIIYNKKIKENNQFN